MTNELARELRATAPPAALFLPITDTSNTQRRIVIAPPPLPREVEHHASREERRSTPSPSPHKKRNPRILSSPHRAPASACWPLLPTSVQRTAASLRKPKMEVDTIPLAPEHRIYSSSTSKPPRKRMQNSHDTLAPLDPLRRQQDRVVQQHNELIAAIDRRIDHASQQIPIAFLKQRGEAFVQRGLLLSMCKILSGHHRRVQRAALHTWLKRTVTSRVLEAHNRRLWILRQSSLAHACGIIQRHVTARVRAIFTRWKNTTEHLRRMEQERCGRRIQKCWRAWRMQHKVKTLVMVYRERVRYESATRIQSMIHQYLARCEMARVVWLHQRHVAAARIQQTYRRHLDVKIAHRRRLVLKATEIQRVWRGCQGRRRVRARQLACTRAAETVYFAVWLPEATLRAVIQTRQALRIQQCWRTWRYQAQIDDGIHRFHRRRRFFPAVRIQRAWRRFRAVELEFVLSSIVLRVVMIHLSAAGKIQQCFRVYWAKTTNTAARRITQLLRCFQAKRIMVETKVVPKLDHYKSLLTGRYLTACPANPRSPWTTRIQALVQRTEAFVAAQKSGRQRLQLSCGLRLLLYLKLFNHECSNAHAVAIQQWWRWHALRALDYRLRKATVLLQRALPVLYRQFVMRRRRRRVLQQWKRLRYITLHERFEHWKQQYLFAVQARDLKTTTRKLRKALWFHHHKLRKRMLHTWWFYVLRRRVKHSKWKRAVNKDRILTTARHWQAWRCDALPLLCCRNRLRELYTLLVQWSTWRDFVRRKKLTHKARRHRDHMLKIRAVEAWRADYVESQQHLVLAERFRDGQHQKRSFHAFARYVVKMKTVWAFSREKHQSFALRHWLAHVYDAQKWRAYARSADSMKRRHALQQCWQQWTRYRAHQLKQRRILRQMDQHYARGRLTEVIKTWSCELVPLWKDDRLIESVAIAYRSRRLQEKYFRQGCAQFWATTAGARRIAMAIRIQRSYRSKRARCKIFVMKMKVKYQLETRACHGFDVNSYTASTLADAVKQHQWVFVLFAFPWVPVDASSKEAFCTTATTWSFIRQQRHNMAFGTADPTETFAKGDHAGFSLMSWLGVAPHQLPCVLAFWQGVGPGMELSTDVVAARLASGRILPLKRRFKSVCTSAKLVYTKSQQQAPPAPFAMSQLVAWVDRLRVEAAHATAVDLQSFARGFLARRHVHRLRALRKQRQVERICVWVCRLKAKWIANKRLKAATQLQRWIRQVYKRRAFWKAYKAELARAKQAMLLLQRALRRRFTRNRIRQALHSLLATTDKYPNAPLCQECFHEASASFVVARLRCRDCGQVFCRDCFLKTHRSGKRLLHLSDNIDLLALNQGTSKMCTKCDVRGATRLCSTCRAQEGEGGETLAVEVAMCLGCFELAHSGPLQMSSKDQPRRRRRRPWWSSRAFQQHNWRRLTQNEPAIHANGLTAAQVMEKHGWMSKDTLLVKLQQAKQDEESPRERETKLLAIRVQQEAILRDAFDRFDTDKSGSIDRAEFKRMFKKELCEPLDEAQVDEAMAFMDKSSNGLIEFDELLAWFAEDTLAKQESGVMPDNARSLARLKDALRAKRQMRRYKEKLNEFVPSVPSIKLPSTSQFLGDSRVHKLMEKKPSTQKQTVPGFPSVECLAHSDFARKRTVFFRFVQEICGLEWILEDAASIPVTDAMQVFDQVFVPRWNAGALTYDFYFDDESFEVDGEVWQRRWDATAKKYVFTTTRTMTRRVESVATPTTRKQSRCKSQHAMEEVKEDTIQVVEWIDPRRKQMLLQDAQAAFARADGDGSGFIDEYEFHRMLMRELCEPVSKSAARQIRKQLDSDGSGKIDFTEFFQWYAVEKCQDYPLTPQMERTKALLKTRRRAKETAKAAVHLSVHGGVQLRQAIQARRKQQQLERDCRGASPELIELLQEGHEKMLAEKALALHNQDMVFARHWLHAKRDEEERERQQAAKDKAERKAQAKKDKRARDQQRRQTMKAFRQKVRFILIGPSRKEGHAARLQQALTNLDRELQLVEQ